MACGYVVLAHKNPEQVARLAARLSPGPVFLHVDSSVAPDVLAGFDEQVGMLDNVTMLRRRPISWAGWSQLDAALDGFRAALTSGVDHIALLSGQDYPLASSAAIDAFLMDCGPTTSFMPAHPLPVPWFTPDGGVGRFRFWTLTVRDRRVPLPLPRRRPREFPPHLGSAFYVLARDTARFVCDAAEQRRDVVRFYRRTWLPVESFPHSVVMGSPRAGDVIGEHLWYIEWPTRDGAHPSVLGGASFAAIARAARGPSAVNGPARRKLFARKLDLSVDAALFDRIDRELLRSHADDESRFAPADRAAT